MKTAEEEEKKHETREKEPPKGQVNSNVKSKN